MVVYKRSTSPYTPRGARCLRERRNYAHDVCFFAERAYRGISEITKSISTMITYELAKELKDAGFPQYYNSLSRWYHTEGSHILDSGIPWLGHEDITQEEIREWTVKIPTLAELIAGCGNDFGVLDHLRDGSWGAYIPNDIGTNGLGSTPEEAVARLWLALHSK